MLIEDDPYSDLEHWLGDFGTSGVLTDLLTQVGLSGPDSPQLRQDWVERLAGRDVAQWKATLFQIDNPDELIPPGGNPEFDYPHHSTPLPCLPGRIG